MNQQLQNILQNTFWLESFREWQQEIIEHIIAGNDALVFMPIGGGKSLTYQLPTMVLEGITIVISPLISLMKDQVDKLNELWIRAELINSTLSGREKDEILYELKSFDSEDSQIIQNIVSNHLDVYKIKTSDAECVFDYRWDDENYSNTQICLLHW